VGIFILTPGVRVVFRLSGVGSLAYYLFLLSCVVISFSIILGKMLDGFEITDGKPRWTTLARSPLTDVAGLAAVVLFLNYLIVAVMMALGNAPSAPESLSELAGWKLGFVLIEASVWEEILCRVCFMGLPLLVIAVASGERENLGRFVVGGFEYNNYVLLFLVISSAIFGYAHYGGWGLWKILPTFIFGLAAGWLFHRHGLYAAIMLHFFIDFMSLESVLGLDSSVVPLTTLPLIFVGLIFTSRIALIALQRAFGERSEERLEPGL